MRRMVSLGVGLFVLLCTDAFGVERNEGRLDRDSRLKFASDRVERYGGREFERTYASRGKKGRKYVRRFSLAANLQGDKAAIFGELGYTPHRLAYNAGGVRTERWKYYGLGVEFLFDDEGNLLETRQFPPEGNHID